MEDIQITLAFIWVALMLIYLLGDVLRIFAGDFTPGEIEGKPMTQAIVFAMGAMMVIPIIMILATIMLEYELNRWANIIAAGFFLILNGSSIYSYKNYDKFLLIISLGFNIITIYSAWNWVL